MSSIPREWYALCDKLNNSGYDSLTPDERIWLDLRALIDFTNNGGLISYFYNSGADNYSQCLEALRRLEAVELLTELKRIGALFPGGVPTDIDTRNEIINSWENSPSAKVIDATLEDVHDRVQPLVDDLEKTLEQFVRRQGLAT
jgi:hypothetical protein